MDKKHEWFTVKVGGRMRQAKALHTEHGLRIEFRDEDEQRSWTLTRYCTPYQISRIIEQTLDQQGGSNEEAH